MSDISIKGYPSLQRRLNSEKEKKKNSFRKAMWEFENMGFPITFQVYGPPNPSMAKQLLPGKENESFEGTPPCVVSLLSNSDARRLSSVRQEAFLHAMSDLSSAAKKYKPSKLNSSAGANARTIIRDAGSSRGKEHLNGTGLDYLTTLLEFDGTENVKTPGEILSLRYGPLWGVLREDNAQTSHIKLDRCAWTEAHTKAIKSAVATFGRSWDLIASLFNDAYPRANLKKYWSARLMKDMYKEKCELDENLQDESGDAGSTVIAAAEEAPWKHTDAGTMFDLERTMGIIGEIPATLDSDTAFPYSRPHASLLHCLGHSLECSEKYSNVPISLHVHAQTRFHPSHETVLTDSSLPKVSSFSHLVELMLNNKVAEQRLPLDESQSRAFLRLNPFAQGTGRNKRCVRKPANMSSSGRSRVGSKRNASASSASSSSNRSAKARKASIAGGRNAAAPKLRRKQKQ